jgi:hypothetical protein
MTSRVRPTATAHGVPALRWQAAQLPRQDHVNAAETPSKKHNGKAWLRTFEARMFTLCAVRATQRRQLTGGASRG